MSSQVSILTVVEESANPSRIASSVVPQYIIIELNKLGLSVDIETVSNCGHLARELKRRRNDHLILVTGESVSVRKALSKHLKDDLVPSGHLASVYGVGIESESALIPRSSHVLQVQNHANGINPVLVRAENIYLLPNDRKSIKVLFKGIVGPMLRNETEDRYKKIIRINYCQSKFGSVLNEIKSKLHDFIHVVAHCENVDGACQLVIELSSSDFNVITECEGILMSQVEKNMVLGSKIDDAFWKSVEEFEDNRLVQESLNVIKECYNKYKSDQVFLSFNGGKDCTVLLYLTVYARRKLNLDLNEPLLCLYIQPQNPFTEVENFIEQCRRFYNLELFTINSNVKSGLAELLTQKPELKACLMGTRRSDPYSENLKHFQQTDPDWPQVMRVSPILDWKYSDIWDFILVCNIPYCQLYDMGYTSLGSRSNTGRNPALKYVDELTNEEKYLPAYQLKDGSKERTGRFKL